MYASDLEGWKNGLVGGWSVASIVTIQSGFPFTPQLSYNPSNTGDTRNPVRPFLNPDFKGSVVLGNPSQWFNPAAFIAPPSTTVSLATLEEIPTSARGLGPGIFQFSKTRGFTSG